MKYVIAVFILFAGVSVFGQLSSLDDLINKPPEKIGEMSRPYWRARRLTSQMGAEKFNFSAARFPSSLFSPSDTKSLAEILSAGELDLSFGTNGKTTTQFNNATAEAIAIQSDKKIVLGGYSLGNSNYDFSLVRYNENGTLDSSFGSGGKVSTDIDNSDNEALALAIQPFDDKIIAAGSSASGTYDHFALVRYNTNGSLDSSFGTNGIATTTFDNSSAYIDDVVVQPADGKIVAVGYVFDGSHFHFALARYNSDGTPDNSFGTGGKLTTVFTNFDDLARAVVLQPDGKIVVAGEANGDFALARYNAADGSLDNTFDADGKVTTSINIFDAAYDVAIQTDGKLIAAGEAGDGTNADFALARYNSDGSLDQSFDSDGIVTTVIGSHDEFASSVALETDGKIIAGGFTFNGLNDDFALIRYNTDGSLDSSFGIGGKTTTDFGNSSNDYISGVAIQTNNRIIAGGNSNSDFAAAAYYLQTINCSYTLSPTSANFTSSGGTGNFNIMTETGCSGSAVSNNSWITITGGANGNQNRTVSYSVATNSGAARTGTITVGGQSFTINQDAAVLTYEADVSPRGNGNGTISSTDVSIIQGFQVGLGLPYQSNEFQRADCAPFATRGDGRISSIDVAQAQAYQLGFNLTAEHTPQAAAGPTGPPISGAIQATDFDSWLNNRISGKNKQIIQKESIQSTRELRILPISGIAGQNIIVPIEVDALGDESVYGFSLNYDQTKLTNPNITVGTSGGSVLANTMQAGKIGISVSFSGGTIAAGNNQRLINVQFTIAANASPGIIPIVFSDSPTYREVASSPSNPNGVSALPAIFTSGTVTVTINKSRKRIRFF